MEWNDFMGVPCDLGLSCYVSKHIRVQGVKSPKVLKQRAQNLSIWAHIRRPSVNWVGARRTEGRLMEKKIALEFCRQGEASVHLLWTEAFLQSIENLVRSTEILNIATLEFSLRKGISPPSMNRWPGWLTEGDQGVTDGLNPENLCSLDFFFWGNASVQFQWTEAILQSTEDLAR